MKFILFYLNFEKFKPKIKSITFELHNYA